MKLQRTRVQRSPHQFLRGYKYTPGLGPSGLQAVPDVFKAKHSDFDPSPNNKQDQQGSCMVASLLLKSWEREANSSELKVWMMQLYKHVAQQAPTFLSLWGNKIHSPVFVLTVYCRDRVNRMPTSRACLIQQDRKTNAWQPHLLLPLQVPCSLVCAVPDTHLLTM